MTELDPETLGDPFVIYPAASDPSPNTPDEELELQSPEYSHPLEGEGKVGPPGERPVETISGPLQTLPVTEEGREYDGLTWDDAVIDSWLTEGGQE